VMSVIQDRRHDVRRRQKAEEEQTRVSICGTVRAQSVFRRANL
jgi:hypothetical protein